MPMRTLYLLRHAKSSWKLDYLDDFERPLNRRGKKDAPLMGRVLRDLSVRPDILLSSPAPRAASTARIVAAGIGYPAEDIRYLERLYDAGVKDLTEIVRSLNDANGSAMLVGHEPGLSMVVKRLTGRSLESVPTAGAVAVEFAADSWKDVAEGSGRILFVDSPKRHRPEPEQRQETEE